MPIQWKPMAAIYSNAMSLYCYYGAINPENSALLKTVTLTLAPHS